MKPLQGQKALVAGGDSGIGAALVSAFAKAGAVVGINYRGPADEAETLADEIRKVGGEALILKADVSREAEVRKMFKAFAGEFGRLDILVANAALQRDAPVTQMTLEQRRTVLYTNLTGAFLCAREAVKLSLAQDRTYIDASVNWLVGGIRG